LRRVALTPERYCALKHSRNHLYAPAQYFIQGAAAAGQLAVFGSEPGEKDYNPLWEEKLVTWKAGAKPVLLTSDNQINALALRPSTSSRCATCTSS
jgi:hypothetical protein